LKRIVYAARGVGVVPGAAVVGRTAAMIATQALRFAARAQDLLILKASALELPQHLCRPDAFSQKFAFCEFNHILPQHFARRIGPFPDLPEEIFARDWHSLQLFECRALSQHSLARTQLEIRGDGEFLQGSYGYRFLY
jgi:hypothetical protein